MNIDTINIVEEDSWYKCTEYLNLRARRNLTNDIQLNYMDKDKAYLPIISGERDYISVNLCYRIYRHLSQKEKDSFDSIANEYPPLVRALALYVHKSKGIPFSRKLFNIMLTKGIDTFDEASLRFIGYLPKERFLKKALIFQGFVPLSQYKIRDKYSYIMTNRMIEGEYYIYPLRLSDDYRTLQKGKYQFYTNLYGKVGIPGIIRIKYSNI